MTKILATIFLWFVLLTVGHMNTGCRALYPVTFRTPPPELSPREVVDRVYDNTFMFSTLTDSNMSLRIAYKDGSRWKRTPSMKGLLAVDRTIPGVWLRTEKFGQNIFTLRSHKESFWLEIPDTGEIITGSENAYQQMPYLIRPNEILLWFTPPDWLGLTWDATTMTTLPDVYVFEVKLNGFPLRSVHVDRYNFTINSIKTYNIVGDVDTEVVMERYHESDRTSFPHRITVHRIHSGYELRLQLDDPDFNRELPERTFLPRSRPGWRHIDLDRTPAGSIKGLQELEDFENH